MCTCKCAAGSDGRCVLLGRTPPRFIAQDPPTLSLDSQPTPFSAQSFPTPPAMMRCFGRASLSSTLRDGGTKPKRSTTARLVFPRVLSRPVTLHPSLPRCSSCARQRSGSVHHLTSHSARRSLHAYPGWRRSMLNSCRLAGEDTGVRCVLAACFPLMSGNGRLPRM